MEFGVTMFPADNAMDVAELGREAEAEASSRSGSPSTPTCRPRRNSNGRHGAARREYRRTLDQFVVLGAVAAATSTIKLGTGICLVIQRDPILLAKEVASVDYLSKGRCCSGSGPAGTATRSRTTASPYARRFG